MMSSATLTEMQGGCETMPSSSSGTTTGVLREDSENYIMLTMKAPNFHVYRFGETQ